MVIIPCGGKDPESPHTITHTNIEREIVPGAVDFCRPPSLILFVMMWHILTALEKDARTIESWIARA